MDKAAFENQKVLWHIRKRCQNSNMDCHLSLCLGGDNEKTAKNKSVPLQYITDFKYSAFREKAHLSSVDRKWLQKENN